MANFAWIIVPVEDLARHTSCAMKTSRTFRVAIPLTSEELKAIDDFRCALCLASRAAAVRELLKRGLGRKSRAAKAKPGTR
jgi:hypothetical protein